MFERGLTVDGVRRVLESGETIEDYPEDLPYPSRLVLGLVGDRAIHVVGADTPDDEKSRLRFMNQTLTNGNQTLERGRRDEVRDL